MRRAEGMPVVPCVAAGGLAARCVTSAAHVPHGTLSYMPALFGMWCAGYVIQELLRDLPLQRRGRTPKKHAASRQPPSERER